MGRKGGQGWGRVVSRGHGRLCLSNAYYAQRLLSHIIQCSGSGMQCRLQRRYESILTGVFGAGAGARTGGMAGMVLCTTRESIRLYWFIYPLK